MLDILLGVTNQSNESATWLGDVQNPENTGSIISPHHVGGKLPLPQNNYQKKTGPTTKKPNFQIETPQQRKFESFLHLRKLGPLPKPFTGLLLPVGKETNFWGKHPRLFMIHLFSICEACSGTNTLSSPAISDHSRSMACLYCYQLLMNDPEVLVLIRMFFSCK